MKWQEITVALLVIAAILFLINYFIKLNKKHNCDDCGLMDLKKEKDRIKEK